jgi:DNA-binding CsgD family transcriptional regulator
MSDLVGQIQACGAQQTSLMLDLYQQYLEQQLRAFQSTWLAGYRGSYGRNNWQMAQMHGWKVVDACYPRGTRKQHSEETKRYFSQARSEGDVDPQVAFAVANSGATRVHRVHEAIAADEWENHWMRERLASQGIGERMVGAFTLSPIAESYFTVDRPVDAPAFSADDVQTFYRALCLFPRLHHWLYLERGLVEPAVRPLSPREQQILKLLLGPGTEAEIAEQLELARGTTHNYIGDIYKTFGVSSRFELMQLWLQPVPGTP